MNDIKLSDNPGEHRFELRQDGAVAAFAEYNLSKNAITFTHTEVMPEYEGKGVGSQLAKYSLDQARTRGLKVVPVCEFMNGYIQKHPEYRDIVTPR